MDSGKENQASDNEKARIRRDTLDVAFDPIPVEGATFVSVLGGAKKVARVLLAPGSGLSQNYQRLAIQHHDVVMCAIRGESYFGRPAAKPLDFHQPTLRWMLAHAQHVGIWSAPYPDLADQFARWSIAAVDEGSRFGVTIETNEECVGDWEELVNRRRKRGARTKVFGPTGNDWRAKRAYRVDLGLLFD